MSSTTTISIEKFARLIGTPKCPAVIDVRNEEDFAADPRLIPGSVRRPHHSASAWAAEFTGSTAVAVCQRGQMVWVARLAPQPTPFARDPPLTRGAPP